MKHPIHKAMAGLAFSQQLADQFNAPPPQEAPPQPMDQQPQQPVEAPQMPQEAPQQEQDQGLVQTIKDTITPYMDKIMGAISKQEDEVKQVELKIDGEMTSKE